MHLKRWISALVVLPFLITLIVIGGIPFIFFVSLVCVISLCEYYRITYDPSGDTISGGILLIGLILGPMLVMAVFWNKNDLLLFLLSLNVILSGAFSLTQFRDDPAILDNTARQTQGMTYIALSLATIASIRHGSDGMIWIFLLLAVIFAGDIGAYYVGSYYGKHKLCPSVSPKKTIEGALGGIVANILVGSIFKILFLPLLEWKYSILFFVCAGIAGQIGDLFESALKRNAAIKDSGSILPGHGGLLDRIDALLFAAPITYLFKEFIFK